ncbi:hypothetical protein BGX20_008339, partial [Mortierella sp. AD010]
MVARKPFDNRIRSFCHKLYGFYKIDTVGIRHWKLLESERSAFLEKKIYHVDVDGNLYRNAAEDGESSARNNEILKVPPMANVSGASRSVSTNRSKPSPITADSECDEYLDESDNDEDADDDEVDDDTVENEKELPLIAATSPYDDLVAQLYRIYNHCTPVVAAMSPPLSGVYKELYEYASSNLSQWDAITEVKKKSTMLALSGILNTMDDEMQHVKEFETAKAACFEADFASPSIDTKGTIDELVYALGADKDIWKLKTHCRVQQLDATKNRTESSNRARIINIVEYLCTLIEIDNWGELSENEYVAVWRHIFSILLSTTIAVRSGELGLAETRKDRQKAEWSFALNKHNVKSRKVDLLFQSKIKNFKGKQCRQNIAVFEAKSVNSNQNTTWIHIRKAIRLNKSILCALQELGVDVAPLILDIQGQRAYIYTVKKIDGYYCTGKVSAQGIRLPTTPFEMHRFITDGGLNALEKIKERLFKIDSAVRDAFWEYEENNYQHRMSTTSSLKRVSNDVPTIWTPTKRRTCTRKKP